MNVRVKLQGVVDRGDPRRKASFALSLAEDVTARELVRILAERCGAPFCDAVESSDARLPRHIRLFADGEMISTLEQRLAATCTRNATVNIVVLSPMMGG